MLLSLLNNFEENENDFTESFFPSAAFVGKVNIINYYYLFFRLWDQFSNYHIPPIIYILMETKVSHFFFLLE
jgi:hypothetical protein